MGIKADLWSITGKKTSAELIGIEPAQLTWKNGEEDQTTAASEVWQIALTAPPQRPARPAYWLYLTNGDRWGVSSITLTDEELQFRTSSHPQPLKLGIESITGIQPVRPGTTWRSDESEWLQSARRREKSDLVILRNGDHQTGEISAIDDKGLTLTGLQGAKTLDWTTVGGLLLNPDLAEVPPPAADGWTVLLSDESWLTVSAVQLSPAGICQLATAYNVEWSTPLTGIRWMSHWAPEVVPLSRAPIASQKHQPLLGESFVVSLDRNVLGLPLRSDSPTSSSTDQAGVRLPTVCPLGVGLTSGMTVQWKLDGNFRKFLCGVCLDATACSQGHAVVTFSVNDQQLQKVTLRAGEPVILQAPFDVSGAMTLTIQTEFGENADACDWINLVSPVLVR